MIQTLLFSALIIGAYMTSIFVWAQIIKNNSIVDIAWGMGFVILSLSLGFFITGFENVSLILTALILIWALRLSGHIFLRNYKQAEDFRYANWRRQWGKNAVWMAFWKVFMLQGFFMWILSIPIILTFHQAPVSINAWHIGGVAVFACGWILETVADSQLSRFKKNPKNKGRLCTSGLWSLTRHPNYFGEALLWWGIWLFSIPSGMAWLSLLSPISITWLLRYVSGVPMLEKKISTHPDFEAYARKTPVFIPFFRL